MTERRFHWNEDDDRDDVNASPTPMERDHDAGHPGAETQAPPVCGRCAQTLRRIPGMPYTADVTVHGHPGVAKFYTDADWTLVPESERIGCVPLVGIGWLKVVPAEEALRNNLPAPSEN